jgi:YbgC/YbaW family acyl-CoA thioester hydrolase
MSWTIRRPHRIRWAECDLYGHVNHAAYLTLFEDLRIAHWQALTGRLVSPDHPGPVVAQIEARYLRAVGFQDDVELCCRVASFRRTSYVQDYALLKDGEPCCTARAVLVITRQDTGEKVPLWEAIRAKLLAEGAQEG